MLNTQHLILKTESLLLLQDVPGYNRHVHAYIPQKTFENMQNSLEQIIYRYGKNCVLFSENRKLSCAYFNGKASKREKLSNIQNKTKESCFCDIAIQIGKIPIAHTRFRYTRKLKKTFNVFLLCAVNLLVIWDHGSQQFPLQLLTNFDFLFFSHNISIYKTFTQALQEAYALISNVILALNLTSEYENFQSRFPRYVTQKFLLYLPDIKRLFFVSIFSKV